MREYRLPGPRPGPLQRVVAAVVTTVLLIGLFFAGIIAWIILAGFMLVGGLALSIWLWRQRRRFEKVHAEAMRRAAVDRSQSDRSGGGSETIEGEYVVVDEQDRQR